MKYVVGTNSSSLHKFFNQTFQFSQSFRLVDGKRCLTEVNTLIIFRKFLFQQTTCLKVATFCNTFHLDTVDVLKPSSLVHDVFDAHVARRDELAELCNSARTIAHCDIELHQTPLSCECQNEYGRKQEVVNIVTSA